MIAPSTFLDTIGEYYPNVEAKAPLGSTDYNDIQWMNGIVIPESELIAKRRELDQQRVWRAIQAERDRRRLAGIEVGGNWFHSDDTSRIQHIGLAIMGANMPPGIMWKTMAGSFVQMTPTLSQQIFQTLGQVDMQIFAIAEQHRAAMMQAANPTTYNFLTGWPRVFGE